MKPIFSVIGHHPTSSMKELCMQTYMYHKMVENNDVAAARAIRYTLIRVFSRHEVHS